MERLLKRKQNSSILHVDRNIGDMPIVVALREWGTQIGGGLW
jgi:hypothetical protein